jgi:hypothetical protein
MRVGRGTRAGIRRSPLRRLELLFFDGVSFVTCVRQDGLDLRLEFENWSVTSKLEYSICNVIARQFAY